MRLPIITSILLSLVTLSARPAAADVASPFLDGYNISCYTMDNGMSNNHVDDIYKDSRGFIWVAYQGGGLSRFDGYDFVNFNDANGRQHIKSNFVKSVTEDAMGRLWVAGEGGIDIIDLPTMTTVQPDDLTGDLATISTVGATDVYFDTIGALWISGHLAVHRLTFDNNGRIVTFATLPVPAASHRGIAVRDIEADGRVWIGLGNTVCRIRAGADGSLSAVPVAPGLSNLDDVEYISAMTVKDGQVWVATDRGLFRYDPNSGQVRHYTHRHGDETSLSQNFLTDIAVTPSSRMVVSSLMGLNVYNPFKDNFERAGMSEHGLNNGFVNMMLVDGDRILVGTEGGGINILSPRRLRADNYIHSDSDPHSLSRNPVNAIATTADGSLWIGTVEGGLNVQQPGNTGFTHLSTADGLLSHNSVSALATDPQGRMWVGTWGGGVDVISARPPYRCLMRLNRDTDGDRNIAYIGNITPDTINGGMVIGSNVGILYYDFATDRITPAIADDADVDAYGFIGSLVDRDGRLWMGSARGLVILDLNSRRPDGTFDYTFHRYRLDNPRSGIVEKPTCFVQEPDGTVWMGTNGHGVLRGTPDTDSPDGYRWDCYTAADGLANNTVRGILRDAEGNIWLSTINGLSQYNRDTDHFTDYTVNDGLPDNQFYWNAAAQGPDGTLLLGTTGGLTVVTPEADRSEPIRRPVLFTRLTVGNRPVTGPMPGVTDADIAYTDRLTIHESDKSLTVEFSALDYSHNDNAVYQYRLRGFDNDWITVPADRRWASYTNLSPGHYTLQVRYQPDGIDPDAPVAELPVTVRPYFYKSVWFMVLLLLVITGASMLLFKMRINALTRHRNDEIRRQRTRLTEMNRQVQQMTMDRLTFFTNITHEFRTPITLIRGPIERALKLSTNPKVVEQLNLAERNSRYLLSLVNQLMDFRKAESGKMEVSYTRGDFKRFIAETVSPFVPMAAERGITVRCLYHQTGGDTTAVYDEDSARKIIINLLSNAIKFTPDGGTVTVYTAYMYARPGAGRDDMPATAPGTCYIGVCDTGSGIDQADIDRVFDRFYQGESKLKYPLPGAGDSGIGLYLCRTIAELHGGTITVRNNRTCGCTFRVLLPIPDAAMADAPKPAGLLPAGDTGTDDQAVDDTRDTVIMVVDDNDDMRRYICSILHDRYTTVEANDGVEALDILADRQVDLIISDLMMPRMDGLELSRRVKENFAVSHIPFLILTAKTAQSSRIEGYRMGVDDYLLKPFDESALLARIEGILLTRSRLQLNFRDSMDTAALDIATESRDKKFTDQVMETIRANYRNSYFEVGDFADALGISRSLLNKKLQSLMGQSAGQLVRTYRLNMARELILKNRETRALNISEIAYEVGFNDSKYFTRCFTRHFNTTPSAMLRTDTTNNTQD